MFKLNGVAVSFGYAFQMHDTGHIPANDYFHLMAEVIGEPILTHLY